ncbi:integrase, catalytic region, zinc finger, CCHC-type containing protein [Tanacetum coccineum]
MDVFESMESDLDATWKQNEILNDHILTQTQSQKEINELIKSVNQKTYAYGDVRAQYQDLLITISELKAMIRTIEKVRRALFTTPGTTKSKSLDATSVVAKTSGCSKHMTGNLKLLRNLIEKFMDTVRFRSDHFVAITSYGDYLHGNITIRHVYYVEGLGHNHFNVRQFYDDMEASSPVFLMSKATSTKSWLTLAPKLWPMRVESINRKKYILVIVDDYSRYTWVYFLRTKDEAPEMIKKFN